MTAAPPGGGCFSPDLRAARFLPRGVVSGRRGLALIRAFGTLSTRFGAADVPEIPLAPGVHVRLYRPATPTPALTPAPAVLWIHGGGLVMGNARMDDRHCRRMRDSLGAVVASVEYRLAPEHPFPAALEDCYTALRWLAGHSAVDPDRIAVGGASAGGGLAAALTLLARERAEIRPAFQLLVYPMLDDRTALRTDVDERCLRMWNSTSNRFGWRSYLGAACGTDEVPALAAPARAGDLSGLPPAWLGVGTNDLFLDEDLTYARRLQEAGVPCRLYQVPGAYHGFDAVEPGAPVARAFADAQLATLREALTGNGR